METTEKIVESYVRYIKGWATIPNIKCPGQQEIDLLAIDLKLGKRYHIETSVSISNSYSKLTAKKYDSEKAKERIEKAGQRRTVGFFAEKKFSSKNVIQKIKEYGFQKGKYKKVIVTWGWTEDAEKQAKKRKIELWNFPEIMTEIGEDLKKDKTYFTDDTLRTLQLYELGQKH